VSPPDLLWRSVNEKTIKDALNLWTAIGYDQPPAPSGDLPGLVELVRRLTGSGPCQLHSCRCVVVRLAGKGEGDQHSFDVPGAGRCRAEAAKGGPAVHFCWEDA